MSAVRSPARKWQAAPTRTARRRVDGRCVREHRPRKRASVRRPSIEEGARSASLARSVASFDPASQRPREPPAEACPAWLPRPFLPDPPQGALRRSSEGDSPPRVDLATRPSPRRPCTDARAPVALRSSRHSRRRRPHLDSWTGEPHPTADRPSAAACKPQEARCGAETPRSPPVSAGFILEWYCRDFRCFGGVHRGDQRAETKKWQGERSAFAGSSQGETCRRGRVNRASRRLSLRSRSRTEPQTLLS